MGRIRTKTGLTFLARRRGPMRGVTMKIGVSRVEKASDGVFRNGMQTGPRAFVACPHFLTGGWAKIRPGYEPAKMHGACAYGRNPRQAIAAALRKAAKHVAGRGGAFAKFAGYSKRNRRVRRLSRRSKRRG